MKLQMVEDGLYFQEELTKVSISFVIGNTINKVSVIYKMSIGWEMKIFSQ